MGIGGRIPRKKQITVDYPIVLGKQLIEIIPTVKTPGILLAKIYVGTSRLR